MPSTPTLKLRFKKGTHNILLTNWKEPLDLLKKTHKNKEITYTTQEIFKAMAFNIEMLEDGVHNSIKTPIKGNINKRISKFEVFNNKISNINIL